MRFNFYRPLILILAALAAKSLGTSVSLLLGAEEAVAENIGFIVMIITALLIYTRFQRNRPKR